MSVYDIGDKMFYKCLNKSVNEAIEVIKKLRQMKTKYLTQNH